MTRSTIFIVEDDEGIQDFLRETLLDNGYSVQIARDGAEALQSMKKSPPDLVLLDLGLPKISGETVCTEIKKDYPTIPVIILTAKDTTNDIVGGLNLGADDYMTKPFTSEELLARIKARLRSSENSDKKLVVGDLELDNQTYEVHRAGKNIALTPQEFKLLQYLMKNSGRVLTRDMILNRIWLYSPEVETRVVDVYIGYLRKKIDSDNPNKLIHSIRGFGYTIKPNE